MAVDGPGRPPSTGAVVDRRSFLVRSALLLGGGAGLAACAPPARPAPDPPAPSSRPTSTPARRRDYAEPSTYDWAESVYRDARGAGELDNTAGGLAWDESYALQASLLMFRATADLAHLDRLVDRGYQVLAARDDQRGRPDYLGRVGPVWGAAAPYTMGSCVLRDVSGAPAVKLCSVAATDGAVVDVRPRDDSHFDLTVDAGPSGPRETAPALSTDPRSPAYVVHRLAARAPTPTGLTAWDLRARPTGPVALLPVTAGPLTHARYAFLVHSAMLAAPLAEFAALVRADRELLGRYAGAARDFLAAAQAALAFHDEDWTRVDDRSGLYVTARGAPVPLDGTYLPHNQYLAAARVRAHLYRSTGDPADAGSALLMLNTFVSDLTAGAAPVWPYHWSGSPGYRGYGPEQRLSKYSPRAAPNPTLEDTSHGALDVECLLAGHEAGVGVGSDPLRRISGTFLRRVAVPAPGGVVVGTNSLRAGAQQGDHDLAVPRWGGLARWDRDVFTRSRRLYNRLQPAPTHGQVLASTARLVASS